MPLGNSTRTPIFTRLSTLTLATLVTLSDFASHISNFLGLLLLCKNKRMLKNMTYILTCKTDATFTKNGSCYRPDQLCAHLRAGRHDAFDILWLFKLEVASVSINSWCWDLSGHVGGINNKRWGPGGRDFFIVGFSQHWSLLVSMCLIHEKMARQAHRIKIGQWLSTGSCSWSGLDLSLSWLPAKIRSKKLMLCCILRSRKSHGPSCIIHLIGWTLLASVPSPRWRMISLIEQSSTYFFAPLEARQFEVSRSLHWNHKLCVFLKTLGTYTNSMQAK